MGARIMAVADVFAALTEERPCKDPMNPQRVQRILMDERDAGKLDREVVDVTLAHFEELLQECLAAGEATERQHRALYRIWSAF